MNKLNFTDIKSMERNARKGKVIKSKKSLKLINVNEK